MKNEFFKLFACCIPVKGVRRSIICDLQRDKFSFIPNMLYEILSKHKNKTIVYIQQFYGIKNKNYIDEYINFLVTHGYGFLCENPEEFPDMSLYWDSPEIITNAIIDVNQQSDHNWSKISKELETVDCTALQIRIYHPISLNKIDKILQYFYYNSIRTIELIIPFARKQTLSMIKEICFTHKRISNIYIHSSPYAKNKLIKELNIRIYYSCEKINSMICCGHVKPQYFRVNISMFTESQKFNSCLNRKVSIDVNGNIKNCPSMEKSYGHINNTSLHSALAQQSFKDLWKINKDQIEVCKDCEFRYVCTDCRVFIKNPSDVYSKPSKCNYNPYNCEWSK